MCDKAVDTCPFVFDPVPDRYKTPEMFDKAVGACLPPLIFFLIGLLQINFLKKLIIEMLMIETLILLHSVVMVWVLPL